MRARSVEELLVYQKAITAADAVSDLLKRSGIANDRRLRDQLASASERVASLIAEGFSQSTDRHFAEYLHRSRGSSMEIRTQLRVAMGREYVTPSEHTLLATSYNEIEKMLTGLIQHLRREQRTDRG